MRRLKRILASVLNIVFEVVIIAMHSLSIMGLRHHERSSKVSETAMRVRGIVALKSRWEDLVEEDLEEISINEKDPDVIHAAKEILRIIASQTYRLSIKHNEIHYRLFHTLPWDAQYGPERCPACGCEINDLGFCCCSGAVD